MDGRPFFARLETLLDQLCAAPVSPNTYIRMAYWSVSTELGLPSGRTLAEKLIAVAAVGHEVKIILWEPDKISVRAAQVARQVHESAVATEACFRGHSRISVYREPVHRLIPGSSNHQKITIVSMMGQRVVLLSGLNLSSFYDDTPEHVGNFSGFSGTNHDTSVQLEGPVTDAVEQKWIQRWMTSGRPVQLNTTPQRTYAAQGQPVNVNIATTDAEGWIRRSDIQDLLAEKIAAARSYIYLENYLVSDPTIISAIAARLQQPCPPRVFIVISHPGPVDHPERPGCPDPMRDVFSYLNYISFAKLAFASCTAVTARNGEGGQPQTIRRRDHGYWAVDESPNFWSTLRSVRSSFHNRWMEHDRFQWGTSRVPQGAGARVLDAVSFEGGVRFYAPVRTTGPRSWNPLYVHSKLALIDDCVAVIGSANFSYRSMVYDREMSAFITSRTEVKQMRLALFLHYNMTTPEAWETTAADNTRAYLESQASRLPGVRIVTVNVDDFSRTVPSTLPDMRGQNFTLY